MRQDVVRIFMERFNNYEEISKEQIRIFLLEFYPAMKDTSFRWNLYKLKNAGYITKLSDQKYKVNIERKKIKYTIQNKQIEIYEMAQKFNQRVLLDSKYYRRDYQEMLNISIWESTILNEFTTHQTLTQYVFIELNKYRIEEFFFYLKEHANEWYVTRDYKNEQYQLESENKVIILLPLVSRAPLEKENLNQKFYVTVPKIEKVLVDIFHEKKLFNWYDRYNLKEIYINVYEKYNIDFTTLLYYARNRGKRSEMIEFINSIWGEEFV
ncbi:DUF6577 family protein [Haploplasma axanthum]|nr:DUF6577 family protein [Haploplasma axanthum]